jgi:MacB-like periplasmic core domain/FtsX-like permease family
MATPSSPPKLARQLLTKILPDDIRQEVLGDLEQQYHEIARGATGWYWRQAVAYSLRFGGTAIADVFTEVANAVVQGGWGQDVRHASRSLSHSRGFTLAVVGILGVGLGVTTAMFSVFYGVLIRPFPYRTPDTLVRIDWMMRSGASQAGSLGDLMLWRDGARTLSDIGAYSSSAMEIRGDRAAETVQVTYVSSASLAMLGVSPQLGRLFTAAEDIPEGDVHKALLSHEFWTRSFGQRPDVVGRVIRNGEGSLEIIGVMPQGFGFPNRTDVWVPIESMWAHNSRASTQQLTSRTYSIIGRLAEGAGVEQVREELQTLWTAAPAHTTDRSVRARTLRAAETGELRPYLMALMGGVGCLALICIINVSSLQLARGSARAREFAVRAAIGASAGRNVRVQLVESLLLALAGSAVAVGVAHVTVRATVASIPVSLPTWMHLGVDETALVFCLSLATVAAVLSGLFPAWRALRHGPHTLMKAGRGLSDRAGLRQALVTGEIALSTVLLISAALLIQTLVELQRREPGFRPEGLLAVQISRAQLGNAEIRARTLSPMHDRVIDRLAALPGVVSVAATSRLPLAAGTGSRTVADLHVTGSVGPSSTRVSFVGLADVTPAFFKTMGIPLARPRLRRQRLDRQGARGHCQRARGETALAERRRPRSARDVGDATPGQSAGHGCRHRGQRPCVCSGGGQRPGTLLSVRSVPRVQPVLCDAVIGRSAVAHSNGPTRHPGGRAEHRGLNDQVDAAADRGIAVADAIVGVAVRYVRNRCAASRRGRPVRTGQLSRRPPLEGDGDTHVRWGDGRADCAPGSRWNAPTGDQWGCCRRSRRARRLTADRDAAISSVAHGSEVLHRRVCSGGSCDAARVLPSDSSQSPHECRVDSLRGLACFHQRLVACSWRGPVSALCLHSPHPPELSLLALVRSGDT